MEDVAGGGSGGIYGASQREAAAVLGVAAETLCRWHDAPRNVDRSYSLPALVRWFLARELDQAASESEVSDPDKALTAYRIARTDLAKLELEQKRGNLVRVDVVNRRLNELMVAMRSGLESLPNVLAPELEGLEKAEIHGLLKVRVVQTLEALRAGLAKLAEDAGGAAAASDAENVSRSSRQDLATHATEYSGGDRSVPAERGDDERDGVQLEPVVRKRRARKKKPAAAVVKGKSVAIAVEPKKAARKKAITRAIVKRKSKAKAKRTAKKGK